MPMLRRFCGRVYPMQVSARDPDNGGVSLGAHPELAAVDDSLVAPGLQVGVGEYLSQMWARRDYMRHVPSTTLRSRYMNTALGNLWQLLNPLISLGTYFLIFGLVLGTRTGVDDFLPFLTIGIFVYSFTQRATITGSRSITRNKGLVRSLVFPRAILPVTSVVTEWLAFLPGLALAILVSLAWGNYPTLLWLALPLVVLLHMILNIGFALVAARLNDAYRDFEQILPFVFRMVFYGSGVLFAVENVVSESTRRFFLINPLYDVIEVYRWVLLDNTARPAEAVVALAWTAVMTPFGLWFFRRVEPTYAH